MYKEVLKADGTNGIHVEVEEGWKLLLSKNSDPKRYRNALLKGQCGYLVKDAIAEFGRENGVCDCALTVYVAGFLGGIVNDGDPADPHYSFLEERLEEEEELEDKEDLDDDEDGDNESSDEDGEVKRSDEDGMTVEEDGRGVPLYGRKSRILMGDK